MIKNIIPTSNKKIKKKIILIYKNTYIRYYPIFFLFVNARTTGRQQQQHAPPENSASSYQKIYIYKVINKLKILIF